MAGDRIFNFSAGPCTLPLEVLEEAQREFVEYHDAGMSLIEMSHRSPEYEAVHSEAMALAKEVAGAPEGFEVLFVQGGATLQFAMVPLNLLAEGDHGAYVDTGVWAGRAIEDAVHHGSTYTAWSGADDGYRRAPDASEIELRPRTRYLHITANETIGGVRYADWPDVDVPLVGDVSSEYMSRPLPWDRFDVVYGGVQKNLAPAGMAVVFVRRSAMEHTNRDLASYLRYDVHGASESMFNTPPVFAIWIMGKVLRWIESRGGLGAVEAASVAKAAVVYTAIDESDGFYRCPVDRASRSLMNIVFRLPTEELEAAFLDEVDKAGMSGLKGHRSVGGLRASVYTAMPMEGVERLAELMHAFAAAHA